LRAHWIGDLHHGQNGVRRITLKGCDSFRGALIMAYVITNSCIKDQLCADICPTDCIHPKKDEPDFDQVEQMYIDPTGCIDCGACVPVCTSESIFADLDVPEERKQFIEINAKYYAS
jgi:NAD-dependent dihydropyrimidine dehydrogenase PreA subunit